MYQKLSTKGIHVPNGFATTSEAYHLLLKENGIKEKIETLLKGLDISDTKSLQERGLAIREFLLASSLPKELTQELQSAYHMLSQEYGVEAIDVAVRSSGTAEDLPDASFAGQQETFLNISSSEKLLQSVKQCYASLFTDRAISYRTSRGFDHFKVALSVGIQKMVRSDLASSGVMFTIDTEWFPKSHLNQFIWGLGENVVSGRVNADEFCLKPTLKQGLKTVLKRSLGSKKEKMLYSDVTHTMNVPTSVEEQNSFSISDEEVLNLARQALIIEEYYKRPMDIEWAKDGDDGKLYIVQARPETVQSKLQNIAFIEKYALSESKNLKLITSGRAVGDKIGSGEVKVIHKPSEFALFKAGDVLVADTTNPDWEPIMKKASAVVTNRGEPYLSCCHRC